MYLGSSRGFTLVEILVRITIIETLASLAFSALEGVREKAQVVLALTESHQLITAFDIHIW